LKGLAVAIVLAVVLGHLFGTNGIAASLACGAWSSALALIRRGSASFGFSIDPIARRRLPRIVVAALAMGALLWLSAPFAPGLDATAHGLTQAVVLILLIAGAIAIYSLLLAGFGVIRWNASVNAFKRTAASDLRD
jgi:putative peptidoglycan lipid II flippase